MSQIGESRETDRVLYTNRKNEWHELKQTKQAFNCLNALTTQQHAHQTAVNNNCYVVFQSSLDFLAVSSNCIDIALQDSSDSLNVAYRRNWRGSTFDRTHEAFGYGEFQSHVR